MKYDGGNQEIYDEIKGKLQEHLIRPFIGAGLSANFGYPTWWELLWSFYNKEIKSINENKFNDKYRNPEKLASEISEKMKSKGLDLKQELKKEFKKNDREFDKNHGHFESRSIYESVTYIPLIFPKRTILTTNYDSVLERLYQTKEKPLCRSVVCSKDYEGYSSEEDDDDPLIYHLHGGMGKSHMIIITEEDYKIAYQEETSNIINDLCKIFQNNSALFLGCSLENDRYLTTLAGTQKPHFSIVPAEKKAEIPNRRKNLEEKKTLRQYFIPLLKMRMLGSIMDFLLYWEGCIMILPSTVHMETVKQRSIPVM